MIENRKNYKDISFGKYSKVVSQCNFTNCTLMRVGGIVFDRCNFENCKFTGEATFKFCNIRCTEDLVPKNYKLEKSNLHIITEDEVSPENE